MRLLLEGKSKALKPHESDYVAEVVEVLRLAHFVEKGWTLAEYEQHDSTLLDLIRDRDHMVDRIRNPSAEETIIKR